SRTPDDDSSESITARRGSAFSPQPDRNNVTSNAGQDTRRTVGIPSPPFTGFRSGPPGGIASGEDQCGSTHSRKGKKLLLGKEWGAGGESGSRWGGIVERPPAADKSDAGRLEGKHSIRGKGENKNAGENRARIAHLASGVRVDLARH